MSRVEQITEQLRTFSEAEWAEFRAWLEEHKQRLWDDQIEADSNAGKLDWLIEQALEDKRQGLTTPL